MHGPHLSVRHRRDVRDGPRGGHRHHLRHLQWCFAYRIPGQPLIPAPSVDAPVLAYESRGPRHELVDALQVVLPPKYVQENFKENKFIESKVHLVAVLPPSLFDLVHYPPHWLACCSFGDQYWHFPLHPNSCTLWFYSSYLCFIVEESAANCRYKYKKKLQLGYNLENKQIY